MSTTQTKKNQAAPEAAFDQAKQLNEQLLTAVRKVGNRYVDSYETTVDRALSFQLKVVELTQQEWLKGHVAAQTNFAREITDSYTSAARSALK